MSTAGSQPGTVASLARSLAPVLAGVLAALALQLWVRPHLDAYWAIVLVSIGTNVILAVSLTIVNGFTGQFSMGHAGFLAVGGYAAATIMYYGSLRGWGSTSINGGLISGMRLSTEGLPLVASGDALFPVALLAGGIVAAGLGYLVGLPSLRLKGDYLAIVTLGFGEIVRVLIQQTGPTVQDPAAARAMPLYQLPTRVGGALGFTDLPPYTSLFWVFAVAWITIVVALRLKRSSFGRAFLSIREDEIASEAMGVDTTRYKVRAFVLAAFFAGVGGGLFAHTIGTGLSHEAAGFQKSFDIIIMVVLGGLGSISGAALAAVLVTILPELLRGVHVGATDISEYRLPIYAFTLILVMILRPQGLLGVREVWEREAWGLRRGGRKP